MRNQTLYEQAVRERTVVPSQNLINDRYIELLEERNLYLAQNQRKELPPDALDEVVRWMLAGSAACHGLGLSNVIRTIRLVRHITDWGLRESKDFVDARR